MVVVMGLAGIIAHEERLAFQSGAKGGEPDSAEADRRGEVEPVQRDAGLKKRRRNEPVVVHEMREKHDQRDRREGGHLLLQLARKEQKEGNQEMEEEQK